MTLRRTLRFRFALLVLAQFLCIIGVVNFAPVVADAQSLGPVAGFQLNSANLAGDKIALWSHANGMYVTAEHGGAAPLVANRGAIGLWETFTIIDRGNNVIALRSDANGKYVAAEHAGASALIANRDAIGPWEEFQLEQFASYSQHQIVLKARANGRYVTATHAGAGELVAQAAVPNLWEDFSVVFLDLDLYAALSAFATNYPTSVKQATLGTGVLNMSERWISGSLWLYELFPNTSNANYWPNGRQEVWNNVALRSVAGVESVVATCTVPYAQTGASWWQGIPRFERFADVGLVTDSPRQWVSYHLVEHDTLLFTGNNDVFGRRWPTYVANVGGNIGSRWVMEFAFGDGNERWLLDLGPQMGAFAPKYGLIGYTDPAVHGLPGDQAAGHWRYVGNVQPQGNDLYQDNYIVDRRSYNCGPQRTMPCQTLQPKWSIHPGEEVRSCNGAYALRHQFDGNVVLYTASGQALWSTATHGQSTLVFAMQSDGNAVLYNANSQPIWQSGTSGHTNANLKVHDNGHLVMYLPDSTPIFVFH